MVDASKQYSDGLYSYAPNIVTAQVTGRWWTQKSNKDTGEGTWEAPFSRFAGCVYIPYPDFTRLF